MKRLLLCFISFLIAIAAMAQEEFKVKAKNLNVRTSPSTQGAIIGKISEGATVTVSGIKDGWAAINYKGRKCYVSASYLEKVKSDQEDKKKRSQTTSNNIESGKQRKQYQENTYRQDQENSYSEKSYRGLVFGFYTGYDFPLEKGSTGALPIEVEIGKRFNKNLYWGGGAGISIPMSSNGDAHIPITTNIKAFFPSSTPSSVVPLFMFRAGFSLNTGNSDLSSVILQLMPGLQFPLSKRTDLMLMAGYTRGIMTKGGNGYDQLGVKIGLSFHKDVIKRELPPSHEHCFQVGIETGASYSSDITFINGSLIGSYKITQLLSVGAGYGFGGNMRDNEYTQHRFFARGQYRSNDNLWSPFFACDLGFYDNDYTTGFQSKRKKTSGLFVTPTIGMSLRSSANSYVDFRLGYEFASKAKETIIDNIYLDKINMSGPCFRINFTRTIK